MNTMSKYDIRNKLPLSSCGFLMVASLIYELQANNECVLLIMNILIVK